MNSIMCYLGLNLSTTCFLLPLFNMSLAKSRHTGKGNIQWALLYFLYNKFRVRGFKGSIYAVEEGVSGIGNMQEHRSC